MIDIASAIAAAVTIAVARKRARLLLVVKQPGRAEQSRTHAPGTSSIHDMRYPYAGGSCFLFEGSSHNIRRDLVYVLSPRTLPRSSIQTVATRPEQSSLWCSGSPPPVSPPVLQGHRKAPSSRNLAGVGVSLGMHDLHAPQSDV